MRDEIKRAVAQSGNDSKLFFNYLENHFGKLQKFDAETEYEIKLDGVYKKHHLHDINETIEDLIDDSKQWIALRCDITTDYTVNFFTDEAIEYSVFVYENSLMMKIKKHNMVRLKKYTLFKSSEKFEYNKEQIYQILQSTSIQYMASMRKQREKCFVINKKNGIITASAITHCTAQDVVQEQYEIEYYAHLNIPYIQVTEEMIIYELSNISDTLACDDFLGFKPSKQTKFDFTIANNKGTKTKAQILNDIFF